MEVLFNCTIATNISKFLTQIVLRMEELFVPEFEINLMEPLEISRDDIEADLDLNFEIEPDRTRIERPERRRG